MKRLYVVLTITAVTFFSALSSGFAVFYFLLYALIGAILGSLLWALVNLAGVHVSAQRRSSLARVGDYVETDLNISNRSAIPKVFVEVHDLMELPGQVTGTVVNLKPFQNVLWRGRALLRKRGVYSLGPARAYASDLLGLFRFQKSFPGVEEVIVYPAAIELPFFQLSSNDGVHHGIRHQPTQSVTPSASTVRDYNHGDSLRRIHWPTTIRTRKLMVKEFETDVRNQAWIVLDLNRSVQAGGEIDNTVECGITLVASIAEKLMAMDWPVGFFAQGDQRYFIAPQRTAVVHERLMGMLATAKADGTEPLAEVLRRGREQFSSSSTMIIITPSTEASWIHGLTALLGQRSQLVVVLIDAHSFGGRNSTGQAVGLLQGSGVLTYLVRQGQHLNAALDYRSAIQNHIASASTSNWTE